MKKGIISILPLLFFGGLLKAQDSSCLALGQNASNAFPVCGTSKFKQNTVPICGRLVIPVPCPSTTTYGDTNPFWYKFTCFASGTLGFLITPNNLGDDYDWQLFDITGHNPADVYTDPSLFVVGNWSATYGVTGTSPTSLVVIECASDPAVYESTYSMMPTLKKGHNYLLLISHYTETQSGYSLSFSGGTANITDTLSPQLQSATVSCDSKSIIVKLNKRMQCSSVAANGSDFSISSSASSIISASGFNCSSSFDMDTVILTLNNPLPSGSFRLVAQVGNDGNTILDNCNNSVPVGDEIPFEALSLQPPPMDSLTPPSCAPNTLQLVFAKPIQCSSIAPDGSDFVITGGPPVSISGATGVCVGGLSTTIQVQLSAPMVLGGNYQIQLVMGTDGNTLVDECNEQTPAGATLNFSTKDTVSAAFTYQISTGCTSDKVNFFQNGANGINSWQWTVNDSALSSIGNPTVFYSIPGQKNVQLIVSNGFCTDTAVSVFSLGNFLQAKFGSPSVVCPADKVILTDSSIGNIIKWIWDYGDGTIEIGQTTPAHQYPMETGDKIYTVSLIVQDSLGCNDTATKQIERLKSCYIAVPNAFTPNGDGVNDYLYPLNAYNADNLEFRVFNRFGQLVFETRDWTKKWDGTIGGLPQATGTYVWTLQYTDHDSGKRFSLKGTTVLIR